MTPTARQYRRFIYALAFACSLFSNVPAHAQSSQSLSVTPPLFQLSVEPGNIWQSTVKAVNNNPYPLTVYAQVVNFAPQGETGQGRFVPVVDDPEASGATLAEWITLPRGPYTIPSEQSKEFSFIVEVPLDAPPGGHFAAILVSTEPPDSNGEYVVKTSQAITSLFFVRVEGDVIEKGDIREFRAVEQFVETPEAEFSLRFENKGNVHLQPRGDITITNMWGTVRGVIPINHQTHFGNVLPESIRDFRFTWRGERSISEIGRYKAHVVLGYGEDGSKNVSAVAYFWVIPVKATLITISIIIAVLLVIVWMVRRYVRRMLMLAGVDPDREKRKIREERVVKKEKTQAERTDVRLASYRVVSAPITTGARELRSRLSDVRKIFDVIVTLGGFVVEYRMFFGSILLLVMVFVGGVLYMNEAAKERSYEVTITEGDSERTLSSEEIIHEQMSTQVLKESEQSFRFILSNRSGAPGTGAAIATVLEESGYRVDELSAPLDETDDTTRLHVYGDVDKQVTDAVIDELQRAYGDVLHPEVIWEESSEIQRLELVLGRDALVVE